MSTTQLTERVADWNQQLQVEEGSRLVKNIALTGLASRNGYEYTSEALSAAVPLYNGKPVFLDHAQAGQRPMSRSTRDLVGSIINPRFENGRLRGDIRVVDTSSGRTFLALVEAETPGVGMSHVVLAERSTDGRKVHRIEEVISVDVVVNPATTSTFQESSISPVDEQSSQAEHDEVGTIQHLQSELTRITTERDQLRQQLQSLHGEQRARELDRLLQEAGLPEIALDSDFRERLAQASLPARQALIQERQQLVRRLTALAPRSHPRSSVVTGTDNAQLISAIKHRR